MDNEKTYSAREAAKIVGVAPATITRHIQQGLLHSEWFLNRHVIKHSDLMDYIEKLKTRS